MPGLALVGPAHVDQLGARADQFADLLGSEFGARWLGVVHGDIITILRPAQMAPAAYPATKELSSNAGSSDRRRRSHADRPRLQGLARPASAPTRWAPTSSTSCWSATPTSRPSSIEDVFCGCGMPQGLQAFNIARIIVAALRAAAADRQRGDHLALLRLQPRRDPPRRERDQGRRGRRLRRRRRRVGLAATTSAPSRPASTTRTRSCRARTATPNAYIDDGADRGERRQALRGQPRRHGQVRAALAGARRRPRRRPASSTARSSPVTLRTATRSPRTTARGRARRSRSSPSSSRGVRAGRRRHRRQLVPAQRRRRGGAGDVGRRRRRSSA